MSDCYFVVCIFLQNQLLHLYGVSISFYMGENLKNLILSILMVQYSFRVDWIMKIPIQLLELEYGPGCTSQNYNY